MVLVVSVVLQSQIMIKVLAYDSALLSQNNSYRIS